MIIKRFAVSIASVFALIITICAGLASGQDYPTKPIRIVTGVAGGGSDFTARQVAPGISGGLGQPVIVDNRPQILAPEIVSKAPPDGYTLLITGGNLWIYPLLRKSAYDAVRDFAPIALIERTVQVMVVHPSVPAKSVKELIALAKARPGELNFGSSSVGGGSHLAAESFKSMAGVNIAHVPYNGGAPVIAAVISGEVQLYISDWALLAPHVQSGKLRALAVTSAEPSRLVPGLPTAAASGVPGYVSEGVNSIFAPAKTPASILNRLNQEVVRFLNRPETKERFLTVGIETVGSSPEQLAATMKSQIATLTKLIKDAGIKTEL